MQEALQGATSFGISIQGDNTRKCVWWWPCKQPDRSYLGLIRESLGKLGQSECYQKLSATRAQTLTPPNNGSQKARCERCKFIKINLLHSKGVTTYLCWKPGIREIDIALIQEPWVCGDQTRELCNWQVAVLCQTQYCSCTLHICQVHNSCLSVVGALLYGSDNSKNDTY